MAVTDRDRATIDRWIGAARQGGAPMTYSMVPISEVDRVIKEWGPDIRHFYPDMVAYNPASQMFVTVNNPECFVEEWNTFSCAMRCLLDDSVDIDWLHRRDGSAPCPAGGGAES